MCERKDCCSSSISARRLFWVAISAVLATKMTVLRADSLGNPLPQCTRPSPTALSQTCAQRCSASVQALGRSKVDLNSLPHQTVKDQKASLRPAPGRSLRKQQDIARCMKHGGHVPSHASTSASPTHAAQRPDAVRYATPQPHRLHAASVPYRTQPLYRTSPPHSASMPQPPSPAYPPYFTSMPSPLSKPRAVSVLDRSPKPIPTPLISSLPTSSSTTDRMPPTEFTSSTFSTSRRHSMNLRYLSTTPPSAPSAPVPVPSAPAAVPSAPVPVPSAPVPVPSAPAAVPSAPALAASAPAPAASAPAPAESSPAPDASAPVPAPSTPYSLPAAFAKPAEYPSTWDSAPTPVSLRYIPRAKPVSAAYLWSKPYITPTPYSSLVRDSPLYPHSKTVVRTTAYPSPRTDPSQRLPSEELQSQSKEGVNAGWARESAESFLCHCDAVCPLYGDCCADYYQTCLGVDVTRWSHFKKVQSAARAAAEIEVVRLLPRLGCVQFSSSVFYRVVNKCDDVARRKQAVNRRLCEGRTFQENITSIPFQLLGNKRLVFRNAYCAFCNGISLQQLDLQNPVVYPECSNVTITKQDDLRLQLNKGHCWMKINSTITASLRRCPRPSLVQSACARTDKHEGKGRIHRQGQNEVKSLRGQSFVKGQRRDSGWHMGSDESGYSPRDPNDRQGEGHVTEGQLPVRVHGNCSTTNYSPVVTYNVYKTLPLKSSNLKQLDDCRKTGRSDGSMCLNRTEKTRKTQQMLSSSRVLCRVYKHYVSVTTDNGETDIYANPDCLACTVGVAMPQIRRADSVCGDTGDWTTPVAARGDNSRPQAPNAGYMHLVTVGNETPLHQSFGVMQELQMATPSTEANNGKNYGVNDGVSSFRVYFQLTENFWGYQVKGQTISPQIVTCPDDKVYIPYYSHCETFTCGPHTYPFRGRCLLQQRLVADPALQPFPAGASRFSITATLQPPSPAGHTELVAVVVDRAYTAFLNGMKSNFTRSGILMEVNEVNVSAVPCGKGPNPKHLGCFVLVLRVDMVVQNGSLHDVVVLSESLANERITLLARGFELVPQTVVLSNIMNIEDLACPNSTLQHLANLTLKIDDAHAYFLQTQTTFYKLENIGFELQTFPTDTSTPSLLQAAVCEPQTQMDCHGKGYVHLNASTFTTTNHSLIVILSGDEFNDSQFVVFDNGSAIVCSIYNSTYVENGHTSVSWTFNAVDKAIEIATLCSSLASLAVVLVTYGLLPQLRNVPGVIVMSYSGSLLLSQLLSLLAGVPQGSLCVFYSCLAQAAILSSFLWKSALSFDLVFMLRLKSVQNSSHASRVLMLNCYSVAGWLVPAVLVLTFWLLDHFEVVAIRYGYRMFGICSMKPSGVSFYLIMLPLGLTWLFNIFCFTLALRLIYQSGRRSGVVVRTSNQRRAERRRLMAYARISLLMGGTWLLFFAALAVNLKGLWLAHIVLDGSQGVYLLLCFVLKRRVWTMLKERLRGHSAGTARATTTSETTTSTTAGPLSRCTHSE